MLFIATIYAISTLAGRAWAADEGKCTIATKGDAATAKACAKGGRAEAKKIMKEWSSRRRRGQKFTCDGCHKDLDNYELTKNATDDFKKLEAVRRQVAPRRADGRPSP